jgi:hypothetical protein
MVDVGVVVNVFLSLHIIVRIYNGDVHARRSFHGRPTQVNRSPAMNDYIGVDVCEYNSTSELCRSSWYILFITGCLPHCLYCAAESNRL